MTPEGRVKNAVKKLLKKYPAVYAFWPVQTGFGAKTLDCLLCVAGYFVSIEVKAPGKKPTELQNVTIKSIQLAGGIATVVDSIEAVSRLDPIMEALYAGPRKPKAQNAMRSRRSRCSKSFSPGQTYADPATIDGASRPD